MGTQKTDAVTDIEKWEQQKQHLIALGFHKAVGLTERDYYASLLNFQRQLEKFKGRFDRPLLIDPRVPLTYQLERFHVSGSAAVYIKKRGWSDFMTYLIHQEFRIKFGFRMVVDLLE